MSSQISKIDAASRQLDAAIRMYLGNEDQLAIHALVMASIQLLRDLAKIDSASTLENQLKAAILPGKEAEFWRSVKGPSNFLKHADRDPDATMREVSPAANGHLMLLATILLGQLGVSTPEAAVFMPLHLSLHPDIPLEESGQPLVAHLKKMRADSVGVSREEHFSTAREALRRVKAQRRDLNIKA